MYNIKTRCINQYSLNIVCVTTYRILPLARIDLLNEKHSMLYTTESYAGRILHLYTAGREASVNC
jgi:hypothetical protein